MDDRIFACLPRELRNMAITLADYALALVPGSSFKATKNKRMWVLHPNVVAITACPRLCCIKLTLWGGWRTFTSHEGTVVWHHWSTYSQCELRSLLQLPAALALIQQAYENKRRRSRRAGSLTRGGTPVGV